MKSYRLPRLQSELMKLFNMALSQKLSDPRLAWVQITEVIISKDLRHAKLYFSHYNNSLGTDAIRELLIKSTGIFKQQIAGAKIMRTIPELSYYYDTTEDRAQKIETLLASVKDEYEDSDYDPDIDIDDYLDDDDYFDFDEEDDDYEDFEEDLDDDE